MSVNCNTIVALDDKTLEEKSSLGRSVSVSIHAALSNCYKAIETLEMSHTATGAEAVYFYAAITKLEAASQALRQMREILAKGKPSEATIDWIKTLDYDRLYIAGAKRGLIPPVIDQWNHLVVLMKSLDHLAITNCLITDIEDLRGKIHSMIATPLSSTLSAPLTTEQVEGLCIIQTALIQFSTFAQMVSYLNAVEPMDPTWCRYIDVAKVVKGDDEAQFLIQ